MRTIETVRVRPVTVERISAAWVEAHPIVRRAVVAAVVTACALGTVAPAPPPMRWSLAVVGAVLALASLVDVRENKLPNRLLATAMVVVFVGVLVTATTDLLVGAVSGTLLAGGPMLLVRLARGVGMGDVKMAAVVGASTGALTVVAAPLAIAVGALMAASYGLLTGRQRLPLGPALWAGWAISLSAVTVGWLS